VGFDKEGGGGGRPGGGGDGPGDPWVGVGGTGSGRPGDGGGSGGSALNLAQTAELGGSARTIARVASFVLGILTPCPYADCSMLCSTPVDKLSIAIRGSASGGDCDGGDGGGRPGGGGDGVAFGATGSGRPRGDGGGLGRDNPCSAFTRSAALQSQ